VIVMGPQLNASTLRKSTNWVRFGVRGAEMAGAPTRLIYATEFHTGATRPRRNAVPPLSRVSVRDAKSLVRESWNGQIERD
jgi:hypothetical protein